MDVMREFKNAVADSGANNSVALEEKALADVDWAGVLAYLWVNDEGITDNNARIAVMELRAQHLREAGMAFFVHWPRDRRRWKWLAATVNTPPRYLTNIRTEAGMIGKSSDWQFRMTVDATAQQKWNEAFPAMRSAFLASPEVTLQQRCLSRLNDLHNDIWNAISCARANRKVELAFGYVVGLNEQSTNSNAITLRDFSAAGSSLQSTKVDGLAGSQSRFASPPTVNVERLEVIEDSTSIPCSQPNPGGLLNTVTKSPLAHAQTTLSVFASTYSGHTSSVGDANSLTTSFGSTGPIDRAGQWLYRIPASCEDRTSFRDYAVAPWHVPCIRPASFSLNWAEAHQSLSTPTGETPLRSPAQFARR